MPNSSTTWIPGSVVADFLWTSQIVGLKNICYPFDAFYEEYKQNKSINPAFIERASNVVIIGSNELQMNEITRLERCQLHYRADSHHSLCVASMQESDLLNPRNCIICNKPIEDLQEQDLQIVKGTAAVSPSDKHFETTSYNRCSNPQCLSRTVTRPSSP